MKFGNTRSRLKAAALAVAVSAFSLPSMLLAQQDAAPAGPAQINIRTEGVGQPIVVTGDRELEQDRVRDAVRDIAMRGRVRWQSLERYQAPLCVGVLGLGEELGQRLRARIEATTQLVGHEVAPAGCIPNAFLIMVDDPERLIDRMREERRDLFDPASLRRIRMTLNAGYPAITWSISGLFNQWGMPAENTGSLVGLPQGATAGELLLGQDNRFASALDVPFGPARLNTVVVFDAYRLDNVHLDQLADYAAMRILGDPQPFAELDDAQPDTIMNLFRMDPMDAAPGLTLIDLAYLRGLYAMGPRDPGTRLEHFVLTAYDELRESDCNLDGGQCSSASAPPAG